MAIVANTPRTTYYTLASAGVGPFLTGFRVFEEDAVSVYVNGVPTADWEMSSTFSDGYDDNSEITFEEPLEVGDVIVIDGAQPAYRDSNYLNGDPGMARKVNIELGRLWASVSELTMKVGRSIRVFGDIDPVIAGDGYSGRALMFTATGFEAGPTATEIAEAYPNAQAAANSAQQAADAALAAQNALTEINGKITVSVDDPSGGSEGDLWFKYTPL